MSNPHIAMECRSWLLAEAERQSQISLAIACTQTAGESGAEMLGNLKNTPWYSTEDIIAYLKTAMPDEELYERFSQAVTAYKEADANVQKWRVKSFIDKVQCLREYYHYRQERRHKNVSFTLLEITQVMCSKLGRDFLKTLD